VPEKHPELYQVVGAALRDIAQARFTSDVYSRQISFLYEQDPVLRRFPVPRVDVEEVELTLHFAVQEVAVDNSRRTTTNAAIGSLFGQYAVAMARNELNQRRGQLQAALDKSTDLTDDQKAAAQRAINGFFTDEVLENLTGRLLQYFNDTVEEMVVTRGQSVDVSQVTQDLERETVFAVLRPEDAAALQQLESRLGVAGPPPQWQESRQQLIKDLDGDISGMRGKYPDYNISVSVDAGTLGSLGAAVSSIRVKSTVKNYKWSKVDVDEGDLRHVRTLVPE